MAPPDDLFDRVREWADLVAFADAPGPGVRLALVRGRRRQGKSFLLRRLSRAMNGLYYQALEEERAQALAGLGHTIGRLLGVPGGGLSLTSWEDALRALDLPETGRPRLLVIDEFPYLLRHSPELPSLIQRFIDDAQDGGRPLRLVLCGSDLSVMGQLLTGTKALRGRAMLDCVVRPFDFRTSAGFWGIEDPHVAFAVDAVLGGTPGYRDLLTRRPPASSADFDAWVTAGPLNPASALFREDEYLLAEGRGLSDRALYHSVLAAVASGRTSQGAIAGALGREQRAIQHPLRALEEVGFLIRTDDALRARRPFYRIADPIIRFHHVVTRPDLARFEDRGTEPAWESAKPRFHARVLGPHFEQLARDFTRRHWEPSEGTSVALVNSAVINDAAERSKHELDVVVRGAEPDAVLALGEAKHTHAAMTVAELDRLDRVRAVVTRQHPSAATATLLLFSAPGFDRELSAAARSRSDVQLISLSDMYGTAATAS